MTAPLWGANVMDAGKVLALLQTNGAEYNLIPGQLLEKAATLGFTNAEVAVSCLHDRRAFVLYSSDRDAKLIVLEEERLTADISPEGGRARRFLPIDLKTFDELGTVNPRVYLVADIEDIQSGIETEAAIALLRDYCLRMVQRQRAKIRRAFIEAKVGSDALGTFCYRLLNESLARMMAVQVFSIFVLDKNNDDLRLRGQVPRRSDKRHLSDVSVAPDSASWLRKAFAEGRYVAEFSPAGNLKKGQTIEDEGRDYFSRLIWPIQLQFRASGAAALRERDPVIGVIRLSNVVDGAHGTVRPFHCFDAFAIQFAAESLHNIIGSYVDRDVEGFDRDLAFHAAKTPAAGCLRNLKLAAQLLFDPLEVSFLTAKEGAMPPQFALRETGVIRRDELVRAFNNAYAFALNIAAQVERANITEEFYPEVGGRVDRLFADVIQKAINLAPYFEVSHSTNRPGVAHKLSINRLFDLDLPPPVIGDEGALTSVFNNIIENSVKYSRRNSNARIEFSWHDEGELICVSVRDYGIGIPPEDAVRIFTRGVRSDRAKKHTVRGNGLGLSYCARVVKSFGGDVAAVPLEDGLRIEVRLKKAQPVIS